MEDETLAFYDQIINLIPKQYRQIDEELDEPTTTAPKKTHKRNKNKSPQNLSMVDMQVKAQMKIDAIQQQNRDKSMAKIKELTEQHEKEGRIKKSKSDKSSMFNDLVAEEEAKLGENDENGARSK